MDLVPYTEEILNEKRLFCVVSDACSTVVVTRNSNYVYMAFSLLTSSFLTLPYLNENGLQL